MAGGKNSPDTSEHLAMLERLAESKDFMCFVVQALDEFCAWEQGYGEYTPFSQGVRSAGAWIIREVGKTEKGRSALGSAFISHLTKVTKNHTNEEGK